jgi:hypothetical protein
VVVMVMAVMMMPVVMVVVVVMAVMVVMATGLCHRRSAQCESRTGGHDKSSSTQRSGQIEHDVDSKELRDQRPRG